VARRNQNHSKGLLRHLSFTLANQYKIFPSSICRKSRAHLFSANRENIERISVARFQCRQRALKMPYTRSRSCSNFQLYSLRNFIFCFHTLHFSWPKLTKSNTIISVEIPSKPLKSLTLLFYSRGFQLFFESFQC
jgi:hypothetical protein